MCSIISLGVGAVANEMTVEDMVNFSGTFKLSDACLKQREKDFAKSHRHGFLPDVPQSWRDMDPKESTVK